MILLDLSTSESASVMTAPTSAYQAARWMRHFHAASYMHIGWQDHGVDTPESDVLPKYGFLHTPVIELNRICLLLESYGPLLACGTFAHLSQNETSLARPDVRLMQVALYQATDHCIVLNGYINGFEPRILYRDPSHPDKQYVLDFAQLRARLRPGAPLYYLNCPAFPKPCSHVLEKRAAR